MILSKSVTQSVPCTHTPPVSSKHPILPVYFPWHVKHSKLFPINMIFWYLFTPRLLVLLPILFYLLPYIRARAIRDIPGPRLAAFSNIWLMYQCRRGRRYLAVDNAHKKYGPVVRIQPNHVSIADADAIPIIYSHTGGWTKRYEIPIHRCPVCGAYTASELKTRYLFA